MVQGIAHLDNLATNRSSVATQLYRKLEKNRSDLERPWRKAILMSSAQQIDQVLNGIGVIARNA